MGVDVNRWKGIFHDEEHRGCSSLVNQDLLKYGTKNCVFVLYDLNVLTTGMLI